MSENKSRSIGELFARNKRDLLDCLSRRVGRENAFDLLQETFVRMLRSTRSEAIVDQDAYLRTTALNLARDFSRRSKSEAKRFAPGDLPDHVVEPAFGPSEHYELTEKTRLLYAAIEALPPKCRQVFIMRRFHDLSQDEIARRLGVSRNMVEKHLRLALERCRAALD
jgi:RNA polymerase sigma factor (sigma-70 family)